MQVIESINKMQEFALSMKAEGKVIGFVPTMGYLHEGHLSLMDVARKKADVVVTSIYVNPTQFGPNEDFDKYPRDEARDIEHCKAHAVDVVFLPKSEELYPKGYSTYVDEEIIARGLCGISRPQLFKGVCTIVTKLLNIVLPDFMVLGQKDAQQVAVIKKMLKDLNMRTKIMVGETVREPDGLAMSSRNAYLDEFQRRDALRIYESLLKGKELVEKGYLNTDRILAEITHHMTKNRRLRVIYVSVVHRDTMEPLKEVIPGKSLVATAVWCDEIRLIDNILL